MGRIIGGLGSPHAPSIGALIDKGAWSEPGWETLLAGYKPMQDWLARRKPDAAILVYNTTSPRSSSINIPPSRSLWRPSTGSQTRASAPGRCRPCAAT